MFTHTMPSVSRESKCIILPMLPHTIPTFDPLPISLPFLQDGLSEEHKHGTVDGLKAGEILRSLAALGNTGCVKAGMEAAIEADADAVVRMLTGSSGVSSGGRVRDEWRRKIAEVLVSSLCSYFSVFRLSLTSSLWQ